MFNTVLTVQYTCLEHVENTLINTVQRTLNVTIYTRISKTSRMMTISGQLTSGKGNGNGRAEDSNVCAGSGGTDSFGRDWWDYDEHSGRSAADDASNYNGVMYSEENDGNVKQRTQKHPRPREFPRRARPIRASSNSESDSFDNALKPRDRGRGARKPTLSPASVEEVIKTCHRRRAEHHQRVRGQYR